MDVESYRAWLERYRDAWERQDPDVAAALFAEDGTCQETPFSEPMRGRESVRSYWSGTTGRQEGLQFQYTILATGPEIGINHWSCSFVRTASRARTRLDGIFALGLDEHGLCTEFREWCHREETPPA